MLEHYLKCAHERLVSLDLYSFWIASKINPPSLIKIDCFDNPNYQGNKLKIIHESSQRDTLKVKDQTEKPEKKI